jgi:hypothetical protein
MQFVQQSLCDATSEQYFKYNIVFSKGSHWLDSLVGCVWTTSTPISELSELFFVVVVVVVVLGLQCWN